MYKKSSDFIILTFIVTAIYDVILRFMSENYYKLPSFLQYNFIKYLIPYFKKHTVLSAALIAGFVGAATQYLIIYVYKLYNSNNNKLNSIKDIIIFLIITFIISSLFGILMKSTKLFPYLDEYYYKPLGLIKSMYHDGISGLIVQGTLLFILFIVYK